MQNVLSDFVPIFIDVFIWYPNQYHEQTTPLIIYSGPICALAIIQPLFRGLEMQGAH